MHRNYVLSKTRNKPKPAENNLNDPKSAKITQKNCETTRNEPKF